MRLSLLAAALAAPLLAAPAGHAQSLRADGAPTALAGTADAPLAHARWSPAGDALAASRPDHTGLWRVALDGAARPLYDGAAYGAQWRPDGSALLIRADRWDGPRREHAAAVVDAATGEATVLGAWRAHMPTLPRWSADGSAALVLGPDGAAEALRAPLAAEASVAETAPDAAVLLPSLDGLAVATAAGVRVHAPIAGARLLNATPSPDGALVAFEVLGGGLHVARPDGSGLVALGPGHRPAWSPDGRWVAFMRTEDDGYAMTAADLWAARADGSAEVRLTRAPGLEMNPSWSPDGARIAYDDGQTVYLLPVTAAAE